ncbi:MAG: hypothetical protein IH808_07585 [Proteobacteria bacterium]|nr:hypothetical protein [Pseudomonadota bacterium]
MARWYDRHDELGKYLDLMAELSPEQRDELVKGIMVIIKRESPDFLTDLVLQFPLDLFRRRWYDKDPYLWLVFNGLEYADDAMVKKVIDYFKETASAVKGEYDLKRSAR